MCGSHRNTLAERRGGGGAQNAWAVLEAASAEQLQLRPGLAGLIAQNGPAFVEHMAAAARVYTIASGGDAAAFKAYMFAFAPGGAAVFLVELLLDAAADAAQVTVKTDASHLAAPFASHFLRALTGIA